MNATLESKVSAQIIDYIELLCSKKTRNLVCQSNVKVHIENYILRHFNTILSQITKWDTFIVIYHTLDEIPIFVSNLFSSLSQKEWALDQCFTNLF